MRTGGTPGRARLRPDGRRRFFLLTPPILVIFDAPVLIFGIPLLHVYCFAVWLVGDRLRRLAGAAHDSPTAAAGDSAAASRPSGA